MIVYDAIDMHFTSRHVECPKGGFKSIRLLLKSDGMGFGMTQTTINPTSDFQLWHYKHHLEACYCVAGKGILKDDKGHEWKIEPHVMYALDKHDKHYFKAIEPVLLICVFNPPLIGREVHQADGSYSQGEA